MLELLALDIPELHRGRGFKYPTKMIRTATLGKIFDSDGKPMLEVQKVEYQVLGLVLRRFPNIKSEWEDKLFHARTSKDIRGISLAIMIYESTARISVGSIRKGFAPTYSYPNPIPAEAWRVILNHVPEPGEIVEPLRMLKVWLKRRIEERIAVARFRNRSKSSRNLSGEDIVRDWAE
jgi:hypothetical protein